MRGQDPHYLREAEPRSNVRGTTPWKCSERIFHHSGPPRPIQVRLRVDSEKKACECLKVLCRPSLSVIVNSHVTPKLLPAKRDARHKPILTCWFQRRFRGKEDHPEIGRIFTCNTQLLAKINGDSIITLFTTSL